MMMLRVSTPMVHSTARVTKDSTEMVHGATMCRNVWMDYMTVMMMPPVPTHMDHSTAPAILDSRVMVLAVLVGILYF